MIEKDTRRYEKLMGYMVDSITHYFYVEAADIRESSIPFDLLIANDQFTMLDDLLKYYRRFQHHFVFDEANPVKSKYPYNDVDKGCYRYQKELVAIQAALGKSEHIIASLFCKVTCKDPSYADKLAQTNLSEEERSSLEYWIDTITVISPEEAREYYNKMMTGEITDGKLLYMKYADGYLSPGYRRTFNFM